MLHGVLVRSVLCTVIFLAPFSEADPFTELLDLVENDPCTGLKSNRLSPTDLPRQEVLANQRCSRMYNLLKNSTPKEQKDCSNGRYAGCADTPEPGGWITSTYRHRCAVIVSNNVCKPKTVSIYSCVHSALKKHKSRSIARWKSWKSRSRSSSSGMSPISRQFSTMTVNINQDSRGSRGYAYPPDQHSPPPPSRPPPPPPNRQAPPPPSHQAPHPPAAGSQVQRHDSMRLSDRYEGFYLNELSDSESARWKILRPPPPPPATSSDSETESSDEDWVAQPPPPPPGYVEPPATILRARRPSQPDKSGSQVFGRSSSQVISNGNGGLSSQVTMNGNGRTSSQAPLAPSNSNRRRMRSTSSGYRN